MAHFDKKSGKIILSVEDEEIFKEFNQYMQTKKTPWSDSIIKKIMSKFDDEKNSKESLKRN